MAKYLLPKPSQGRGVLSKIQQFLTPSDAGQAASMMVNPVGAVLPGMVSGSRLVPIMLKILREKGLNVKQAETMAMDAATAGKIGPDQFKMVYEALKKIGEKRPASVTFASVAKQPLETATLSVAPAGVERSGALGRTATARSARLLKKRFEGGR